MYYSTSTLNSLLVLILTPWYFSGFAADDVGRFNFNNPSQKSIEIPFHTFNNQVIIPVKVNGRLSLNFVLDTGSSQAILFDRQLGKDLGLEWDRKIEFAGAGNGHRVVGYRTTGVDLELSEISGESMGMVVLSQDYLNMRRFDIHGVIGYQLFVRFAVSLDYQRHIMTLMEPDQYDPTGFHQFDLSLEQSKPFLETEILLGDNQRIASKLMVDTGAAYGLSLITGTHPQIQPPKQAVKIRLASGLSGDIHGYHGITQIRLSPELAPEVVTLYIHAKDYARKGQFSHDKMGSIGGEFLINYLVIMDYVNAKVYLKPQSPAYLSQKQ